MTDVKANDYDILDDDAILLLNGSGIFVLSNRDAPGAVTDSLHLALTQMEFEYVDAFPKKFGGRVISVKCIGQEDRGLDVVANVWTSKF